MKSIPPTQGEEAYVKPGAKIAYRCEYIDRGLRAWSPRFIKAKYAPSIHVHYSSKAALIVLFTGDQDWFLVTAPYVREA